MFKAVVKKNWRFVYIFVSFYFSDKINGRPWPGGKWKSSLAWFLKLMHTYIYSQYSDSHFAWSWCFLWGFYWHFSKGKARVISQVKKCVIFPHIRRIWNSKWVKIHTGTGTLSVVDSDPDPNWIRRYLFSNFGDPDPCRIPNTDPE